ncbi:MAG: endonuclease [Chitinophagaceae bacterium]|nr:endonuclease [Chitinophagaceae bacterium]
MKKFYCLVLSVLIAFAVHSQISLSGSNYSQDFDGIGSGLPAGFRVSSNATASALGTAATFTNIIDANSPWNSTTSGWKNVASADGLISSSNGATQAAHTDRSVGIRQSGSVADPGAALEMQLANTTGFGAFTLSFKLQSLDITSPRITTWRVDYGVGTTPSAFTQVATVPVAITTGGSTFTNTTVTVSFGNSLDDISQNVWIRITSLTAATGSGNRATTGIDDISLSYSLSSGCTPPATQASAVSFVSITNNSFAINWTAGSGSNSLVVLKQGSTVSGTPVTGIAYTANSVFGSGQTIAANEYIVYNGTGNSVTVTGLLPGTTYYAAVFSFDNTFSCYNTTSPATNSTATSCGEPTIQVSTVNANASLVTASISWSGGNGSGYIVKINSVNSFTAPADGTSYTDNTTYSGGEQVLYAGSNTSTYVTGLTTGTAYYVTVYNYNTCAGLPDYLTTGNTVKTFTTLINNSIPLNYYSSATGLSCAALKTGLSNIVNTGFSHQSYDDLWAIYQTGDIQPAELGGGNVIWDIYSDDPTGPDPYEFAPGTDQCGSYSGEGDCYNREHSFPQSWFGGGTSAGPGTDYHHIFPTDGYVNGHRSNYPYGRVGSASYTSANGSKLGTSNWPGISGTVFEPINEYKGDVARAFLYMVTCYQNNMASWEADDPSGDIAMDGTNWPSVEIPYLQVMLSWHNSDPVSQKEVDRNNAALGFQGNRNPFVDHPEYVDLIWSASCGLTLPVDLTEFKGRLSGNKVLLNWTIERAEGFSHFEIERSVNGGTFVKAGTVNWMAGINSYSFADDVSAVSGKVLYRLKMVDDNSVFKYSKTVSITLAGMHDIALLYPNPARGTLNIAFRKALTSNAMVYIADASGRNVKVSTLQKGQMNYSVNIDGLAGGLYILRCVKDAEVSHAKFMVQL